MRKIKKVVLLFLTLAIMMNCIFIANAATNENVGVSEVPPEISESLIVPFGVSKPSSEWNLSSKGQYNFSGNSYSQTLYSNYYFTGVTKVEIKVTNNCTSKLTVKLLKSQTGVDWSQSTKTINSGEYQIWSVSGLSTSSKYILSFSGPSDFSGYIKAI